MDDFRQATSPGQLTGENTITLACTAAEVIRGLNWATRCDAGMDQPAVAYGVIGALGLAAARLGQTFTQITRYLQQAAAAGRLGHDQGQDVTGAVGAAAAALHGAHAAAAALARELGAARQAIAAVHGRASGLGQAPAGATLPRATRPATITVKEH